MIPALDDGIVVAMGLHEFDWDRFEAEGEEIARRMREVSRTMAEQNAASRAERARYEERKARAGSTARETPDAGHGSLEERLERFERKLTAMAADLSDVRERMATRVEVEAIRDSLNIIADGYAQTQHRLAETSSLLKRYVTSDR